MFYLFYGLIWTISWLPMGVLYVLSDLIFPLIYYVARYRRKVVRRNLQRSFPDYSHKQILRIEKKFYHFFCDLMMEIIRQLHAPKREMKKRMTFENLDLLMEDAKQGKSVMIMTGHYCNWEWTSVICLHLPQDFYVCPVYMRLKNKHFDKLMLKLRSRYGAVGIEKNSVIRKMVEMKKNGEKGVFGMISDQSPRASNIRHRLQFLNQDTPVFLGTEQLAKKYRYPVYYLDIKREKRGYYRAIVKPIALDPAATEEYEITTKFMSYLEQSILERPGLWLWSHNRWKHSKNRS
ncbi:MAG: lysophospholipid acyltransferase family protein [Paludibacter sp.]|nr:lysophospholipid acyltransferase family protein [Paludibacter sp.]MDD4426771.1 lysophospholipid acyltransferase family protein [Paludibacter sp.]